MLLFNVSMLRCFLKTPFRASKQMGAAENGDSKPGCSKHIPRSRKASSSVISKQQPRSESMRSSVLVKTTKNISSPSKTSGVCSKKITESLRKPTDSFKEEDSEKVIKIEERYNINILFDWLLYKVLIVTSHYSIDSF